MADERRAHVIRGQLMRFDWFKYRLFAIAETDSYDWAHDLAAAIDEALTEFARDDAWTEENR